MEEKDINIEETKEAKKEAKKAEKEAKKVEKKSNKEQEEILRLTTELGQEKEKTLRIQAEMMNFKKRKEDEVSQMYKYANEDILKSLLPILDNFERALKLEDDSNKEFLKGFNMIYTNIINILNENEVSEMVCDDVLFDPSLHQAVLTDSNPDYASGMITEVLQKGYKYKDRVLRPAMVKVND